MDPRQQPFTWPEPAELQLQAEVEPAPKPTEPEQVRPTGPPPA